MQSATTLVIKLYAACRNWSWQRQHDSRGEKREREEMLACYGTSGLQCSWCQRNHHLLHQHLVHCAWHACLFSSRLLKPKMTAHKLFKVALLSYMRCSLKLNSALAKPLMPAERQALPRCKSSCWLCCLHCCAPPTTAAPALLLVCAKMLRGPHPAARRLSQARSCCSLARTRASSWSE